MIPDDFIIDHRRAISTKTLHPNASAETQTISAERWLAILFIQFVAHKLFQLFLDYKVKSPSFEWWMPESFSLERDGKIGITPNFIWKSVLLEYFLLCRIHKAVSAMSWHQVSISNFRMCSLLIERTRLERDFINSSLFWVSKLEGFHWKA